MPSNIIDQADQQRAAIEHLQRIPVRTPAFTPMLGARSQARSVVMLEDPVKMDAVRRAKMLTPDLAALRTSDDARDVESILHAEALAAELDEDSSDESDAFEGDFDNEDDTYYDYPYEQPASDGDEDVVSDDENGEPQPGSSKAGAQDGSKRSAAGRKKKPEGQRAEEHAKLVETGFSGFTCGCKRAEIGGMNSCLDGISKGDLRAIHRDTYGNGKTVQLADVLTNIHRLYWDQAVPISKSRGGRSLGPDGEGSTRKLPSPLMLLTRHPVCSRAFEMAVGGSRFAHRSKVSLVKRGLGPTSLSGEVLAKVELRAFTARAGIKTRRAAWARTWWADELILHDWLPNETAIQFKGVHWDFLHKQHYWKAAAANSGYKPLKYKAWKAQMLPGAQLLAEKLDPPLEDSTKIRVRRSARHSNFPECNECKRLRAAYLDVMTTAGSSQTRRDSALDALKAHMNEWQTDRAVALKFKDHASGMGRDTCYECDDKCGSQWLMLPVASEGRDTKDLAKFKFDFAIQCNHVVGNGGCNRFMIVPAHVRTGSNFGLTCFVMTLYSAYKNGRFAGDGGRIMFRHTDGGSDNLSVVTHVVHWLLVWLGIFDEFWWFRFDAGHSHTEMADRFFSMMKKFFKIDGAARCQRLDGFEELETHLRALFSTSDSSSSTVELEYLLANWDFDSWLKDCGVKRTLAGISYDNVFRYKYDPSSWAHGCVKVTYKDRLSRQRSKDGLDCEWGPLRQVKGSDGVIRNVTDDVGVTFIECPPRIMMREPQRENFRDMDKDADDDEVDKPEHANGERGTKSASSAASTKSVYSTSKSIQDLVSKRAKGPEKLTEKAVAHWNALKTAYDAGQRAGALPDMPVTHSGITLHGCPVQLLPILKAMRRFDRPLTYWDPFVDEPPASWPDPVAAAAAREERGLPHRASEVTEDSARAGGGPRDPRQANNVTGLHLSHTERARLLKDVSDEQWVQDFAEVAGKNRSKPIQKDSLYLMQLAIPEGGFKLGFAEAGKPHNGNGDGTEESQHEARWFAKTGDGNTWSDNPTFVHYMLGSQRSVEYVPSESFLMEVDDQWLTESSVATKHTTLRLKGDFMRRLRLLKEEYPVEFGDGLDRRHQQTGAQQAAPRAPHRATDHVHRATDPEGEPMRAEGGGKRPADGAAADHAAAKRPAATKPPATTPLPSPALNAVNLAVMELQRYVLMHLPGALVTKELGSAVSDKELKGDVQLLVDQGLQECGVLIGPTHMRLKLIGLKTKTWMVVRGPPSAAQGQSSVLGFIAYGKATYAGSPAGYIHELHVHASLRGKGVGTALMVAAEDDLRTMGLSLCYLTVHTNNTRARSLYQRRGYQSEQTPTETKESCGYPCLELSKTLGAR